MSIENAKQVNNNSYEFDIFIKSTNSTFFLSSYQCAFDFKVANDGGTLNFLYLSGSSQLTNIPSYSIGISQVDSVRELTFASGFGSDSISATAKKVGRFRLQSTSAFTGSLFQIDWKFQGIINTILIDSNLIDITNPANHSNLFLSNDSIPPVLVTAYAPNAETVILNFSEQIYPSTANDIFNYQINNGVTILNAVLSQNGGLVTLTTSPHSAGLTYTVTVNNLTDIAGNIISALSNSSQYLYEAPGDLMINVKVFLQGPFSNGSMNKSLNTYGFIPLNQPYKSSPWNYSGSEAVQNIPTDVVDWIVVELRYDIAGTSTLITRAAFVKTDGSIVDLDGKSNVKIKGVPSGSYYAVIIHRNHLAVMSSVKIELSTNPSLYDFTTSADKAYGSGSQTKLNNGTFGMYAGDGNGNGNINKADANGIWKQQNGLMGYYDADFDMNGGVNIADKNEDWKVNQNLYTNVPN